MLGKDNKKEVGRPRVDDPKMNVPNYTLKQSTILEIEILSEKMQTSRSNLLQILVENGLNIIKSIKN